MGIFNRYAECGFCGERVSTGMGSDMRRLKDCWICPSCKKYLLGYSNEELNLMPKAEASIVISNEKKFMQNTEIRSYKVQYLGGYPNYNDKMVAIELILYNDFLRLKSRAFQDFKTILIKYCDIQDIKVVSGPTIHRSMSYYMKAEQKIHIDFFFQDSLMTIRLDFIVVSDLKRIQMYDDLIDILNTSGIRNKFRNIEHVKTGNIADDIRKFKELLDMGAITQDEYEQKKKELLNL